MNRAGRIQTKVANLLEGAAAPVPQLQINTGTPQGLKGPAGLAPKQSGSRVNVGAPPTMDAGASAQKAVPPLGGGQMKTGSEDTMMTATRPSVHDMVKAAMDASADRLDLRGELARQGVTLEEKVASRQEPSIDTEKLASALEFVAEAFEKEAESSAATSPGQGPGHLTVTQTNTGGTQSGDLGGVPGKLPWKGAPQQGLSGGATNQTHTDENKPAGGGGEQQTAMTGHGKTAGLKQAFIAEGIAGYMGHQKATAQDPNAGLEGAVRGAGGYFAGSVPGAILGHAVAGGTGAALGGLGGGLAGYHLATQKYNPQEAEAAAVKQAFSLTADGHKYDASEARSTKEKAISDSHAAHKYETARPGLSLVNKVLSSGPVLTARHAQYTQDKHEQGRNAYNPFGGYMTPVEGEIAPIGGRVVGGLAGNIVGDMVLPGLGGIAGGAVGHHLGRGRDFKNKKEASAPIAAIRQAFRKVAGEDVSPQAHVSGKGNGGALQALEAGQTSPNMRVHGSQPALVGSNEAPARTTPADVTREPRKDMGSYLNQPAQVRSADPVLHNALAHAAQAGVKTAAARAFITNMFERTGR